MIAARSIIVVALVLAGSVASTWQRADVADLDPAAGSFATSFRRAVAANDRRQVVAHLHFPLTVSLPGLRIPTNTAAEALERYDAVFTPALRARIATDRVVATGDRLTMADGLIECRHVAGAFKVVAVRVPRSSADPGAAAAVGPRRVIPRPGPTGTPVAETLAPGGTQTFLVFARQGQFLEVRLQGGDSAWLTLAVQAPDGGTLNGAGSRVWTGRVRASGDYRLLVSWQEAGARPAPYTLLVNVRD